MKYTRKKILENRVKWVEFLMKPKRKKTTGLLDAGSGYRCCLGHGCYILEIEKVENGIGGFDYGKENYHQTAPDEFVEAVGLYNDHGQTLDDSPIKVNLKQSMENLITLADINDNTDATPQEIGKYLESVIEGGPHTPFKPLTDYPA